MKVSVIVPVYNTEKYLRRCLDSLVNQTLDDIEIIIIDDKSPDNSALIIDEYKEKHDNKIKVIHNKNNKGIGYNRNIGIKKSSGKYVVFVDSDDYLDKDNLEKMYDYSEKNKTDITVCMLKKVDFNGKTLGYENIPYFKITNLKENPNLLIDINMGPANKIFNRALFDDDTYFSENLKYEDMYVIPKLIKKAKKIGMMTDTNYNYVIHEKSETTTMNERVFDILKVMKKVNEDIGKNEFYKELEFLNIRTLFRYTLQQKNQSDKKLASKFIDETFKFLNSEFPDWKNNEIWKKRNILKRIIEGNKTLTKIYCKAF